MLYLEHSLQRDNKTDLSEISTNPIITNFKPVGEAIAKHCNQREFVS